MPAINKLWVKIEPNKGYFASEVKNRTIIKIPYIRWGQAWMFNAFCSTLYGLESNE